jgi:hypothetical protein
MKKIFLIAMFLCLVVLGARGVHAQPYDPYYDYNPYWNGAQYQGEPREYDPYYELHAMLSAVSTAISGLYLVLFSRRYSGTRLLSLRCGQSS